MTNERAFFNGWQFIQQVGQLEVIKCTRFNKPLRTRWSKLADLTSRPRIGFSDNQKYFQIDLIARLIIH